jgi:hypothetical protein
VYDYYDLLGVDRHAEVEAIERAFRERLRDVHPDRDDSADAVEEVVQLQRARTVLADPARRKDYDRLGHREFLDREQAIGGADVDLRAADRSRSRARDGSLSRSTAGTGTTRRRAEQRTDDTAADHGQESDETGATQSATAAGEPDDTATATVDDGVTLDLDTVPAVGSGGDEHVPEDWPIDAEDEDGAEDDRSEAADLDAVVAIDDLLDETNVGSVDPRELLSRGNTGTSRESENTAHDAEASRATDLDAVVAIDDLLDETNVGSVDPDELLSNSEDDHETTSTEHGDCRRDRQSRDH